MNENEMNEVSPMAMLRAAYGTIDEEVFDEDIHEDQLDRLSDLMFNF